MAEHRMRIVAERSEPGCGWQYRPRMTTQTPRDVYLCGECGVILLRTDGTERERGFRMTCYNCGTLNEWRGEVRESRPILSSVWR